MNSRALIDTAKMMVAGDKGLLAMDESNPTVGAILYDETIRLTKPAA